MASSDLVSHMLSTALTLLTFTFVVLVVRKLRGDIPVDPLGLAERLIAPAARDIGQAIPPVHVEFRDTEGRLMDLGSLVSGELRNGRGRRFPLHEGVFVDCDANIIRAGAVVKLTIQHGAVRETTTVRLDDSIQVLYVSSTHSRATLLEEINRVHTRA